MNSHSKDKNLGGCLAHLVSLGSLVARLFNGIFLGKIENQIVGSRLLPSARLARHSPLGFFERETNKEVWGRSSARSTPGYAQGM